MTNDIDTLKKALATSPDNIILLMLLVETLYKINDAPQALEYLQQSNLELNEQQHRMLASKIAIEAGAPALALHYCRDDSAEELIIKAKAYATIGNKELAAVCYEKAIQINSSLEDTNFLTSLKAPENLIPFTNHLNFQHSVSSEQPSNLVTPFMDSETKLSFKEIGGLEDVKKQIYRTIIAPFQKPTLFQKFKRKAGGGILLYGPPGCGKTLIARATAGECGATFYNIAIVDILDRWIGEAERKLHAIFEQARRTTPSVLFFDELEAFAGKRRFEHDNPHSGMISQFLSEMDGFLQNNQGVLVLAATNVPWAIDSAFRRPGRFDRLQFVPPPDLNARLVILRNLMEGRPTESTVDLSLIAKRTIGFSGADLKYLVETACDLAIEHSIEIGTECPLSISFLQTALSEVKPSTMEWLTTARNYARYANEDGQYDAVVEFLSKHGK